MNPKALFRTDVEEFIREAFQRIFLHCLDHNYSGKLFAAYLPTFNFLFSKWIRVPFQRHPRCIAMFPKSNSILWLGYSKVLALLLCDCARATRWILFICDRRNSSQDFSESFQASECYNSPLRDF